VVDGAEQKTYHKFGQKVDVEVAHWAELKVN